MNYCRICLEKKKKMYPLNDSDEGVNCASIISSVSNVKIVNTSSDMICCSCRKKLKEFYEFKLLIERSDLKLNKLNKVFKFNNIEEVDFLFDFDKKGFNSHFNYNIINSEIDYVYYNNTLIKRLNNDKGNLYLPEEDFLIYVKYEPNDDEYIDFSDNDICLNYEDCDNEEKMKNESKFKENEKNCICIKPILQKDLRIIRTNIPKDGRIKSKFKEQTHKLREDICPYCGKKTRFLKSHILQHTAERKFCCDHCNRRFYTKKNLETHIMKIHLKKRKFKCDHCIASFNYIGALATHMVAHTDIREFACKICEKTFKWKSGLNRHMLVHNFAKRFECEICKMSFVTKYAFQHHYRVHTRERPYKCELCSLPYSYKRDFNKHCLKKHGVLIDRRPVNIMNEEVLKKEKILMKDLVLRMQGIKTEREPLDYFQGPQGALAFAKAVKVMQNKEIQIDNDNVTL